MALLSLVGFVVLGWMNNKNGSGYHQWDVRLDSMTKWAKVRAFITCDSYSLTAFIERQVN